MCGIAGIHNYGNHAAPITVPLLARLLNTMRHRGPNAEGTWINATGDVGLGFRRLSIIDLSPLGNQPMANEDGTVHIVFNGEIYNFQQLRPALEEKGHIFRSHTDSEVILHLYEELGPACVDRLDGMFAFAIWDSRNSTWLLARDRLGVKPLYYTQQQGLLLFASEIKAILAHPLITPELNHEAMHHYLTFKTSPAPCTLFSGIQKLEPGNILICDRRGVVAKRQYWDVASAAGPLQASIPESEAVEGVRSLFSRAVAKRMIADVPVGAFLSGGLDSSAVVAQMTTLGFGPVKTFSVGIRDLPQYSEFPFARAIARHFGTQHHEIEIGIREVEEYLPQLVHQQDEPLADPVCVPLYYVSKLAAQAGVPVVLVGEGSDEQFFGYDTRVSFLRRYQRFWRPLLAMPRPLLTTSHRAARWLRHLTGKGAHLERLLQKASTGADLFFGSVAFAEKDKADLLEPGVMDIATSYEVVQQITEELRGSRPQAGIAEQVLYLDLKIRLAELLLMRVDKITMSQSLEAREPFLDHRLIEYSMTLPLGLKLKRWNPKHIFKEAMRELVPSAIVDRPKQPFAAPVEDWLRSGLGGFARKVILESRLREHGIFRYSAIERILREHELGSKNHGVQIWTLMNLSAWYDHWISGASAGA